MRRLIFFCFCLFATGFVSAATRAAQPPSDADVARQAQRLLAESYPASGPGAAILVARVDRVLYRGARGMADIELGVPLAPDQVFRIGSVTKQFSAAGLLKLVESGKVSLADPLSKYLNGYPNGNVITVRQLLDHTSGVKSYTNLPGIMDGPIRRDLDTAALVDSFKGEPADFAPGAGWAYNNSGYVLVGAVIEAASGQPWHRYLQQALFAPLGMTRTRYGDHTAIIPGHVRGYSMRDGKPAPARYLSMTQPHAAGALVSTVDDLLRWNRALHEGRVLKSETYREMVTPQGKASENDYGFGIGRSALRGQPRLAHGGGIFGFSSYLLYVPGPDITVAILQNSDEQVVPGQPGADRLAVMLGAIALGDPYPEARPIAVDAATLKQMEGVYRIDDKTTRVLRLVDGGLTAQRTGGSRLPLVPIATDSFVYADSLTRLLIERDAAGAITGMRVFQDGEGEGKVAALTRDPLPAARSAITLPRAALERVTGTYATGPAQMKVFLDGETLKAQLTGQPAFELFAESAAVFFLTLVDATLTFAPVSGQATGVTLRQAGQAIEFVRTP